MKGGMPLAERAELADMFLGFERGI